MYLEHILKKSKGSTLLPFLLRFLFSDREASPLDPSHMTSWPWTNGDSLWQGVTQALEQSFPLSEASFYRGQSAGYSTPHPKSYMDVLLKRIQCCNSVVSSHFVFNLLTLPVWGSVLILWISRKFNMCDHSAQFVLFVGKVRRRGHCL